MTRKRNNRGVQRTRLEAPHQDDLRYEPAYRPSSQGGTDWAYLVAGTFFAAAGGYLIYRGVTAYGETADGFYDNRSRINSVQVRESVTVDRPAGDLYSYWRDLGNLGSLMTHLESVRELGGERSRWVAKGPLGMSVEWDAVITDDRRDELIAWRSVEDADVPNEGAVRFSPVGRNNEETEVIVSLTYHPPGGQLGAAVAKLFGEEPAQQIRDDLRRFKEEAESGSIAAPNRTAQAQRSPLLEPQAGTPSLGVPGSSSDLRTDNLKKDDLRTKEGAIPSPEGDATKGQPSGEATGYADTGELAKTPEGALPPKASGDAGEKN